MLLGVSHARLRAVERRRPRTRWWTSSPGTSPSTGARSRNVILRIVETRAPVGHRRHLHADLLLDAAVRRDPARAAPDAGRARAGGSTSATSCSTPGMVLVLTVMLFAASSVTWLFQWFQEYFVEAARHAHRSGCTGRGGIQRVAVHGDVLLRLSLRAAPAPGQGGRASGGDPDGDPVGDRQAGCSASTSVSVGVYDQIYGPLGVLVAFVDVRLLHRIVFVFGAAYVASLDARRAGRR